MLKAETFFDLSSSSHAELFASGDFVWDALKGLKEYLTSRRYATMAPIRPGIPLLEPVILYNDEFLVDQSLYIDFADATKGKLKVIKDGRQLEGASVIMAGAVLIGNQIEIGSGVLIEAGAYIQSPVVIGDQTEIRQGAYIRGNCLIGRRCVVGHVTEMKHSVMLDDAKAGHFAYLGDSILGNDVNLGAGTKMANLRLVGGEVLVRTENGTMPTGLRKLGAILGDQVQTGCNSVTNPGTLLGKKSLVLPNVTVPSGYHRPNSLIR